MLRTWTARAAVALVLTPAALAATQRAASPATASPGAPAVPVEVTADGFCAGLPDPVPAGPATFRVTTPVTYGRWWQAMRLRGDATMEQVRQAFADSYSPDPAVSLPALRDIYRYVDFAAGASVVPDAPVTVTTLLTPGTYYLSDTALDGATDGCGTGLTHLQRIRVSRERSETSRPPVNASIRARRTPGGGQEFVMPGRLPRRASVRVTNGAAQPHEVIIVAVQPGTTDADVQAYFDATRRGDTTVPNPFLDTAGGMLAISPGREAFFRIGLRPGRYCVLSFVRNPATGVKSAFEGMFKTVTVG